MPTGNFDEPVSANAQQPVSTQRFRFPADYYSAPLSDVKPVVPKWVPWGCGTAAAVFVLILFGAGALLTGSRLATFMDFTLGMSLGELKGAFADDVSEQQKAAFDKEVSAMRENLRTERIAVKNVQPFLQTMQKATSDDKVTPAEVDQLTKAAADASKPSTVSRRP